MGNRRQALDQQLDRAVDLGILDQVVVVEHEHGRFGQAGQIID